MTPVVHVVLFQFKDGQTPDQRRDLCDKMLGLRNKCLHPASKRPYIKSSMGGLDRSIEGCQVRRTCPRTSTAVILILSLC
ncbi:hypothetical protein J3458_021702 [Metarhizium acridum]|uniref:uncharacterized protein n=1 Tax=Metarhizium acridum TaxID=92637 RepID=UPI001C6BEB27|nr:hypothetical protein J3458_021702 [Metarhizium acridum]